MIPLPTFLPQILMLLPLRGVILMPRVTLPIPIFDEDQIQAVQDLAKNQGLIGIAQPRSAAFADRNLSFFSTGCLGRILSMTVLGEDQAIVTIHGACRFDIIEELEDGAELYKAAVSYDRYQNDLVMDSDIVIDRPRLFQAMRPYFEQLDIAPNWDEIERSSNEKLISTLAMICPFNSQEKQALLESPGIKEQSQIMTMLLEIGTTTNHDAYYPARYH
ncbi:MAG: LON peptidase substrate-binding domain-containing protein [Alphaproteobacteria bacterium]